jgi:hypothetical protein
MPNKDRIVEQVHAVREVIAQESGGDLDRIIDAALARQADNKRRVVRLAPKRVATSREA